MTIVSIYVTVNKPPASAEEASKMEAGTLIVPLWAATVITGMCIFSLVLTIKHRRGLFEDQWGITIPVIATWSLVGLACVLAAILAAGIVARIVFAIDALMALVAYKAIYDGGERVDWRSDLP